MKAGFPRSWLEPGCGAITGCSQGVQQEAGAGGTGSQVLTWYVGVPVVPFLLCSTSASAGGSYREEEEETAISTPVPGTLCPFALHESPCSCFATIIFTPFNRQGNLGCAV